MRGMSGHLQPLLRRAVLARIASHTLAIMHRRDDVAELDDLIDLINKTDSPGYWSESDWEQHLTRSIPNWRSIIADVWKDPLEWKRIENIKPKKDYDDLCRTLVSSIGLELAKRWFYSDVDEEEKAVKGRYRGDRDLNRGWLFDNRHLWSEFDSNMKDAVLTFIFDKWPGEPLESLKRLKNLIEHHRKDYYLMKYGHRDPISVSSTLSFLLNVGYVPSPHIEQLRNIIQEAGDRVYSAKIDEMISRREKACESRALKTQGSVRCNPNRNERQLIERLMEITGRNGYLSAALPPILLSSETPPIFVKYPELEEEGGNEEHELPRDREPRRPETISIEEFLGVYQPQHEQIIIYERGIRWRKHRLNEEWLFAVVLIHEIGHWITHRLPKPGIPTWATNLYVLGEKDLHEGWAQLMTWWIADQVGGEFKQTFEKLNRNQSPPYRVFEQFKYEPIDEVMASLEKLRLLSHPACLQDWKDAIP